MATLESEHKQRYNDPSVGNAVYCYRNNRLN